MLCELIQRLLAETRIRLNANPSTSTAHPVNQDGEESPSQLEEVNLEEFSIHFLCTYSTHPNWRHAISSSNDYGQTLAHISVTLGYFQLLQHLVKWKIDLDTKDKMGLTALHYAYLFKQEGCARFLIHSGANQFILDDLGRSPSDLSPSLGAILHSVGGTDENTSSNHASTGKSNPEVQEETKMLNMNHSLVQQWAQQVEDERRNEVLSPKSQNPDILCPPNDTKAPPVIDSTDEKTRGVKDHQSPSGVHSSPDVSPTVAPEETETQVGITFGSDIILPLTETSAQTDMNRPSHTVSGAPIELEAKTHTGDPITPSNLFHSGGLPLYRSFTRSASEFYTKDQLLVQRELFETIDMQYLPILESIFRTEEWLSQGWPIPRDMLHALCPLDTSTHEWVCAFCSMSFKQRGRAIEHIEQHFGLRPFPCTAPNW